MTSTQGALDGLRIIEIAAIGPVPMCGMLLADQGADVVRIDRLEASGLGVAMAPRFDVNARGRRSLALDLKQPAGRDMLLRLLDSADVLLEGLRPGAMERLGLGPEECMPRQPRLVYGRMTGYGQTGPLAQTAGHDLNYLALTGALHAIGAADRHGGPGGPDGLASASASKPIPPLNLVADYGGGALYLAFGVMAALHERQRSGHGQVVDAAMVDGAASLASIFFGLQAAGQWDDTRGTNLLDGGAPFYDTYATADGRHVALAPLEPKFFAQFAAMVGLDSRFVQRQYDRRLWPEMRAVIAALLVQKTRDEWAALMQDSDACLVPVLSFAEAPLHAHAAARGAFIDIGGVVQPAPAPRFSRSAAARPGPAPEPGAHTRELLAEAGLDAAQIDALLAAGVALQATATPPSVPSAPDPP